MSEHLPFKRPRKQWEYGVNYGARRVRVFMDKTDWDFELGHAKGGSRLFSSVEDLRESKGACIDECGIVEVEATLVRIVKDGKH